MLPIGKKCKVFFYTLPTDEKKTGKVEEKKSANRHTNKLTD